MIPIFKQEIDDNLAYKIANSNSIAFESVASQMSAESQKSVALTDCPDLFSGDLFYFDSVLASTGWNKNDDVFSSAEMWASRKTPVDKKINYMHDETNIVGHMVSSKICDQDGQALAEEMDINTLPNKIDIVVGGVLYTVWEKPQCQEQMNDILSRISSGDMFVSMECLFNNFDYALSKNSEQIVLARDEHTAFLTKYLRSYGGVGEYNGYKIGRILKNFVFSGKGLVNNPANPRSVILKDFAGTLASLNIIHSAENYSMTITQEQYDALAKKLELAEASAKTAAEKSYQQEIDALKSKVSTLENEKLSIATDLSVNKEVVQANEERAITLQAEIENLQKALDVASAKLLEFEREASKATRLAMFADVDIDAARAEELVTKFSAISDEQFTELVTAIKKCVAKKPVEDPEEKDKKAMCTTVEPTEIDALSTAQVVDDKASVKTVPHDDGTQVIRSKASEWLSGLMKSKVQGDK